MAISDTEREHDVATFHNVKQFEWSDKILPGDLVVCPGTIVYRVKDFADRDGSTRALTLAYKPVLIIGVIDGDPTENKATPEMYYSYTKGSAFKTFVLMTRHGVLITCQCVGGIVMS